MIYNLRRFPTRRFRYNFHDTKQFAVIESEFFFSNRFARCFRVRAAQLRDRSSFDSFMMLIKPDAFASRSLLNLKCKCNLIEDKIFTVNYMLSGKFNFVWSTEGRGRRSEKKKGRAKRRSEEVPQNNGIVA